MRAPIVFVFGMALALSALFASEAMAQRKAVVVEQFRGPRAAKIRSAVQVLLGRQGVTVIPDKNVAMTEARLGLAAVSQGYTVSARQLGATAFIGATMVGSQINMTVRRDDGVIVGRLSFPLGALPNAGPRMASLAGSRRPSKAVMSLGGGGGGRSVPPPRRPARGGQGGDVMALVDEGAGENSFDALEAELAEEQPRRRRRRGALAEADDFPPLEGDADAELSEDFGDDEELTGMEDDDADGARLAGAPAGGDFRIGFVLRTFSRNFAYNQSVKGEQQGYRAPEQKFNNLPLVPAPGVELEYFPAAFLGVFGSYSQAIAGSKDEDGTVFKTNAFSWLVGAKSSFAAGSFLIEPSVAYGSHVFKIEAPEEEQDEVHVAPVDYRHVRVGGGIRMPLAGGAALTAGGHYLHILSAGDILDEDKYFDGAAVGGEAFAAYSTPLGFAKGFDLRLGLDLRRIAFAFSPEVGDERIAGGAIDQYIGFNVGIGYNM